MRSRSGARAILSNALVLSLIVGVSLPSMAQDMSYSAPTIDQAYVDALSKLPDWNGSWEMTGHGSNFEERFMFDPDHTYTPPDPAGDVGGLDFGPLPGSYDMAIPYKPEYRRRYMKTVAKAVRGQVADRIAVCQPYGMPRIMSGAPEGPTIIMTPTMIIMLLHFNEARFIYIDGRSHPTGYHLLPSWEGHSIGHWEGATLVVDTVGLFAGNYDQSDAPHSDQIHVVERFRLLDHDILENQMTIEDPVMFTAPWVVTRVYKRAQTKWPDRFDFACVPGNSVQMINGYQKLKLPSERTGAQTTR
jgi:hypothetical protein